MKIEKRECKTNEIYSENDSLIYDVYFGSSSTPPPVSSGQSETNYDPGTLDCE